METPDLLNRPSGDAGVRPAGAADADSLGAIHSNAWRAAYSNVLPQGVLAALGPVDLAASWRDAVVSPPSPDHLVLVAHHGPLVVAFLALDPLGEIVALHVDPPHQRRGHASRLLAAAVDHLQARGVTTLHCWSVMDDEPRRAFFTSAGLGPDGQLRSFTVPGSNAPLTEAHLIADISKGTP